MTYEKFEHHTMRMLLQGDDLRVERLFDQYLDAEVLSREESEGGFTVYFLAPAAIAINESEGRIFGVEVSTPDNTRVNLELVIKDGLIDRLKGTFTAEMSYAQLIQIGSQLTFSYKNENTSEITFQTDEPESEVTFVKNISTLSKEIGVRVGVEQIEEAPSINETTSLERVDTTPEALSIDNAQPEAEQEITEEIPLIATSEPAHADAKDVQLAEASILAQSDPKPELKLEITEETTVADQIHEAQVAAETKKSVELPVVEAVAEPALDPNLGKMVGFTEKAADPAPVSFTKEPEAEAPAEPKEEPVAEKKVGKAPLEDKIKAHTAPSLLALDEESVEAPPGAITVEQMERRAKSAKLETIALIFITISSLVVIYMLFN